jgi:hypothetical protein
METIPPPYEALTRRRRKTTKGSDLLSLEGRGKLFISGGPPFSR